MADSYDEILLLGYIEGDLSPAERSRVEQWLAADARLAQLVAQMQRDRAAVAAMPDPHTPDWLMDEVDRQLERAMLVEFNLGQSHKVSLAQRHIMRRIVLGTALAAMLMIVAGVVISSLLDVGPTSFSFKPDKKKAGSDTVAVKPTVPEKPETPVKPDVPEKLDTPVANEKPVTPSPNLSVNPSITEPTVVEIPPGPPDEKPVIELPMPTPAPTVAEKPTPLAPDKTPGATPEPVPGVYGGDTLPMRKDLLPDPPQKIKPVKPVTPGSPGDELPEARVDGDDPTYTARQIRLQPSLAEQMEMRVVTRDPAATITQLRKLVKSLATDDATSSEPGPGRYEMKLAAEQLPRVVAELQASTLNTKVQIRKRNLLSVGQVPDGQGKGDDVAKAISQVMPGVKIWPSMVPDYASILRQQLPVEQPKAEDKDKPADLEVTLPVIIDAAPRPINDKSDR